MRRFALPAAAGDRIDTLLAALAAEPDPPTTITEPERARDGHVADALVALELPAFATASKIADIGAGAGFPGLALAVALPRTHVDLVESTGRKCEVIERLAAAAGIANATAVARRAEDLARDHREAYDVVTARALAPLAVLVEYAAPLLGPGGSLVAWKGRRDGAEERAGETAAALVGLEPAGVVRVEPFPAARDHHLHVLRKVRDTPDRFPRRAGMARKRPLG